MVISGKALSIYVIQNGPIYSRYGGLVGVKIVKDQWFHQLWRRKLEGKGKGMPVCNEHTSWENQA